METIRADLKVLMVVHRLPMQNVAALVVSRDGSGSKACCLSATSCGALRNGGDLLEVSVVLARTSARPAASSLRSSPTTISPTSPGVKLRPWSLDEL